MGGTDNGFAWACGQIAENGRFDVDFVFHAFSPFAETAVCCQFPAYFYLVMSSQDFPCEYSDLLV